MLMLAKPPVGKLITVVSVNWYSATLLRDLALNLLSKAAHPERLEFLIIDNTAGRDRELVECTRFLLGALRIVPFDCGGRKGSHAHAAALNHANRLVRTRYILVVDPDIHVFRCAWDSLLLQKLASSQAKAAGAPYPFWKLGKYHNFPSPVFLLSLTENLTEAQVDWSPFAKFVLVRIYHRFCRQLLRLGIFLNRRRLTTSRKLRALGRQLEQLFGVCAPDTGWLIARRASAQQWHAVLFSEVLPDQCGHHCQDWKIHCTTLARDAELFQYEGELFMTHLYSSAALIWRTSSRTDVAKWRNAVNGLEAAAGANALRHGLCETLVPRRSVRACATKAEDADD